MERGTKQAPGSRVAGALSAAEFAGPPEAAATRVHRERAAAPAGLGPTEGDGRSGVEWDKRARRPHTAAGGGRSGASPLSRDDLLRVSEAADLLGISLRTLYRLVDRGQVPGARRLGRTVVIVRPILEHWLLTEGD